MNRSQKKRYNKLVNFIKSKWIPEVLIKCHGEKINDNMVAFDPIFFINVQLKTHSSVSNCIRTLVEFPKWHKISNKNRIQMRPLNLKDDNHKAFESISKCFISKFYNLLGDENLKDVDYKKWIDIEKAYFKCREEVFSSSK